MIKLPYKSSILVAAISVSLLLALSSSRVLAANAVGITDSEIRLGSILALKGKAKGLGRGMKAGLDAALNGKIVGSRRVVIDYKNDYYEPRSTIKATYNLLKKGIFLMVGNVGTPTAKVSLPLLKQTNVPAVGFFTGAGLLRLDEGTSNIVNFRASYVEEVEKVINYAIKQGIAPHEVCAYVQNDSYGMAGLVGVRNALSKYNSKKVDLDLLDKIMDRSGSHPARNNMGPVGVYRRNTDQVRSGYSSLKQWEGKTGYKCRLVVTVGAYSNIAEFIKTSRRAGESWLISAVSFTGAGALYYEITKYSILEGVLMTQVVPLISSDLPIVKEAKNALKDKFGLVSLEGYIVGKFVLNILKQAGDNLTQENFLKLAKQSKFDLGGVSIDMTIDGNQASNLVIITYASELGWTTVE